MIAPTSQILFIVLLAILLPSALSFPYSIYNMRNRRASRAKGENGRSSSSISSQAGYTEPRQQHDFDQSVYRSQAAAAPYYGNYDTLYDTGADNFYADEENVDDLPEREYLYGKPTYHGEYKPTRYYYARAPSYSYPYGDRVESNSNPLDDLHEEMLQEDHNRQRVKSDAPQWLQNAGQPSSLTGNFMKNLMLHNNGMNMDTQSMDMNAAAAAAEDAIAAAELPAYDDEDIENPNSEPYDYFDPLKFQHVNQFNHYGSPSTNKQIYYQDNRNQNDDLDGEEQEEEQRVAVKNKNKNKNRNKNKNQRRPAAHNDNSKEDKDEKDLESLRKSHNKNSSNRKNGGGRGSATHRNNHAEMKMNDEQAGRSDKNAHDVDNYNGGYDTGFDYDEDAWINWNRKRSLPNVSLRPLKALEQKLTDALKVQAEAMRLATPTPPPSSSPSPTPSTSSILNSGVHKHKGQKEVVLSRPATPVRRHYPPNVLDALSKTVDENNQANQMDTELHATKTEGDKQQISTHAAASVAASKKQKRFVSNEASLAQQLNGLKRKIKA